MKCKMLSSVTFQVVCCTLVNNLLPNNRHYYLTGMDEVIPTVISNMPAIFSGNPSSQLNLKVINGGRSFQHDPMSP